MAIERQTDYYEVYRHICWQEGIKSVSRRHWDSWQEIITFVHSVTPEGPDWVAQFMVIALPMLRLGADVAPIAFSGQGEGDTMPGQKKANQHQASAAERIPPRAVQLAAARGLAWRAEYGRGGTAVGVARARDLSNGRAVSWETIERMYRYFRRHEVDLDAVGAYPGERGFPSPGRIAWELWGGDAGLRWVSRLRRLRPEGFK